MPENLHALIRLLISHTLLIFLLLIYHEFHVEILVLVFANVYHSVR